MTTRHDRVGFVLAASLCLGPLAAAAQMPAPKADDVCLSNACSKPAVFKASLFNRSEAAVAAAKKARNAGDLVRAGGTPGEVADVLRALCGQPGQADCGFIPKAGSETWVKNKNGGLGIYGDGTGQPSSGFVGHVGASNPDLTAVTAPGDVPTQSEMMGAPKGAVPITRDVVGADGVTRQMATGQIVLPDGTATAMPPPRSGAR